jgi:ApaG protein
MSEAAIVTGSEVVTRGIRVHVEATYSEPHSAPVENRWFFVYKIRISNESDEVVQLLSRHWYITDALGKVEEVEGPGVVGAQPVLAPGQSFEYSSGCPLEAPFGSMYGTYTMARRDGTHFDAEVALFELRQPTAIH